jgi:hypothetical protein
MKCAQRRNTTHRIALYMYTASQAPATMRATWYSTPRADSAEDTPRMKASQSAAAVRTSEEMKRFVRQTWPPSSWDNVETRRS